MTCVYSVMKEKKEEDTKFGIVIMLVVIVLQQLLLLLLLLLGKLRVHNLSRGHGFNFRTFVTIA